MSLEQIEEQIQRLSPNDLLRLSQWLSGYLTTRDDWQETPAQIKELERRLAEFTADPSIAVPFEPDYFQNLKRQLADERAKKASAR
ncbi:MAG TPA: hypothetical protein VKM56_05695 [Verrucomicrobiae bacterium]|nr:hypothetical protein [Verrucomicrobiae bacterium]